jgi:muramoyltetrapeptide carboxypeptidase LdcA involved in peptidoglycan recycling
LGYSDITIFNNAIFAKTGLVNYSGPHYSTFGQKLHFDYTLNYFQKCLMEDKPFEVKSSSAWSDDTWYLDQNKRELINNSGYLIINEGKSQGTILGANLCTFNLLQGTEYFPDLTDSILFLEDDYETVPHTFDRDLQSLIHLPDFNKVKGLVIGRFQKKSKMTNDLLIKIIKTKKELDNIPVIANVDFGHSDPKITFPIGGVVEITVQKTNSSIKIINH